MTLKIPLGALNDRELRQEEPPADYRYEGMREVATMRKRPADPVKD